MQAHLQRVPKASVEAKSGEWFQESWDMAMHQEEDDIIDKTEPSQLIFHPRRQLPSVAALTPHILDDGSMPLYSEDTKTAIEGSHAAASRPAADAAPTLCVYGQLLHKTSTG